MNNLEEIEKSIIKKYRKEIWSKFVKAIKEYNLVNENDKIMVCISGGKDSFLMAKCFQELIKHGDYPFTCKYVVMNPGYKKEHLNKIINNAKKLNIDIEIFESDIFDVVEKNGGKSPCYLCARMRRGFLYNKASILGCNKIALGHHLNDVIETTLLSIFYGCEVKTMLPKVKSDNFEGIELIRPLYYINEDNIIAWKNYNKLEFLNCSCKLIDNVNIDSKRKEVKELIHDLKKVNKNIEHNIFKSLDNINLDCVLGYRLNQKHISFLDNYDK